MKLVLDERMKHRLTGVMVVLAMAIIFLPDVMKKSNQHFEEKMTVSLNLPKKPHLPVVAMPNQQALFKAVNVAHVNMPSLPKVSRQSLVSKAKPLSPVKPAITLARADTPSAVLPSKLALSDSSHGVALTPKSAPVSPAVKTPEPVPVKAAEAKHVNLTQVEKTPKAVQPSLAKTRYAVQLASFTQQKNAEDLVNRLRTEGYKASYHAFKGQQGAFYQVLVGQLQQKEAALTLQKTLVAQVKLNGFVVKTTEVG